MPLHTFHAAARPGQRSPGSGFVVPHGSTSQSSGFLSLPPPRPTHCPSRTARASAIDVWRCAPGSTPSQSPRDHAYARACARAYVGACAGACASAHARARARALGHPQQHAPQPLSTSHPATLQVRQEISCTSALVSSGGEFGGPPSDRPSLNETSSMEAPRAGAVVRRVLQRAEQSDVTVARVEPSM